jgi:hypothetical protein
MVRWCALVLVVIAAVMAGAKAQDRGATDIVLDGTARTGNDTRPVRFRFFCSSNNGPNATGVLSVELEIPQYEQLHPLFDFEPFEGPDANVGPLTLLLAAGARSNGSERFAAAGWIIASGASNAFMLGVNASRREPGPLRKLAAVLQPLTEGPARLTWEQANAKPGGTPMIAALVLGQSQAEQLSTGLGPCLGAR